MRDVIIARHFLKQSSSSNNSSRMPFLILIVNADPDQREWIFGMSFACYGLSADKSQPFLIDMKIPSLLSDSTTDYKTASCLHGSGAVGDKTTEDMLASVAAVAIQQSVDLELLSAGMVEEIATSAWAVTVMEAEVAALREQVRAQRLSERNQATGT
jgi:hypothetical protein